MNNIRFDTFLLAIVGLLIALTSAVVADVPASAGVVAQLQAMNQADCDASKRGDSQFWLSTLAPEYVTIEATGARTPYNDLIGQANQPPQTRVIACATTVSSVTHDGERYYLFGDYTEDGIVLKGHHHYRTIDRIRDSWRRIGGRWKQTQSLSYELTAWLDGRQVAHHVLPKTVNVGNAQR